MTFDVVRAAAEVEPRSAEETIAWAMGSFAPRIALAWSGAEDVALVDLLLRAHPTARVFLLDTGRLDPETCQLVDRVRARYGCTIEVMFPDAAAVQAMVRANGMNLFYESVEQRKQCCGVRKVEPLGRILAGLDAWMTGLRRDQSPTRSSIAKLERDEANGGIVKLNPIADWTSDQVWDYIKVHNVPYNPLHDRGYRSIGCAPCTRATRSGESVRAGRWWWEDRENKECGLHSREP